MVLNGRFSTKAWLMTPEGINHDIKGQKCQIWVDEYGWWRPPRPQHCLYWPGGTTPKPWLLFWLLIFLCISLTGWWFDAPWVVKVHRNIFFVGPWNLQTLVISMGKPSNVLHRFLPTPIKCQSNMMSSLFICPVSDFISKNWMLVKCRRKPLDWQGKSRDFLDIFPLNPKRG